ncbi:fibronectin type III domain-containing protein [Paludisphaera rhizosphaerae]|uniref:fibronectin type III domain-containing protein n=1 Tax=Paludisphaera rhizosphaerae TaxID=2711216 RepID=UPI0013EC08F8|nr:fibronectin type III domain-containing protein [Paludisphaera rhizosphaerae]
MSDGSAITLDGATYAKGLGAYGASDVEVALDGRYSRFQAVVGIDDDASGAGSAVFQVWADGVKLFDSGVLTLADAAASIDVPVAGNSTLHLMTTDGGDGSASDHADWADAKLTKASSAAYVGTDATTQGDWLGVYGGDGYKLAGDDTDDPDYATVSIDDGVEHTWDPNPGSSTTRALQRADGSGRVAATWFNTSEFAVVVDVTPSDDATHRISLYLLDWDAGGRTERIDVVSLATGDVLDSRNASDFAGGAYLTWDVRGAVRFRVVHDGGSNAVVSGVFFDPVPNSASASFVKPDATTQGDWIGSYGGDGYSLAGGWESQPGYATVSFNNKLDYVWDSNVVAGETRAVQKPDGSGRVAAAWFNSSPFEVVVDVTPSDDATHRISLYLLDWDGIARITQIEVVDPVTGAVLDSREASQFHDGLYQTWDVRGSVQFRITRVGGANAVVSGIFFDPVPGMSTAPATPTGVVAAAVSDSAVQVTWTASAGADGYTIERSVDGSDWFLIGTTVGANATSYLNLGLSEGTRYSYRVAATNESVSSTPSGSESARTLLKTPTGLTAVFVSASSVVLAWVDVSALETGYIVEMSQDGVNWVEATTTAENATNATVTGAFGSVATHFRVSAFGTDGRTSGMSNTETVLPSLGAPTNLSATPASATQVDLTWTDNSSDEQSFVVERSSDGGATWQVASVGADQNTYAATGLTAGVTYLFRVYASNESGDSAFSNVVSITTPVYPSRPTLNTATALSDSSIALSWTDVAGETGYRIERSTNSGSTWTTAGTADAGATTFTDSGLLEAIFYTYRVVATNKAGDSQPSGTKVVATLPSAPINLSATVISGDRIDLTWAPHSTLADLYYVEQLINGTTWTQVGTALGATRTSYSASGPFDASTTYYFRVRAYRYVGGYSAYSAIVSPTTPAYPSRPTLNTATALSDSSIALSWTDVAGETGYRIERVNYRFDSIWTTAGTADAGATTFTDSGLLEANSYTYRVVATNTAGDSQASLTKVAATQPSAPTDLSATVISGDRIDLSWVTHSTSIGYYSVERLINGATWTEVGTVSGLMTNKYTASGPFDASTTYYFRVRAFGYEAGYSTYTPAASPTTPAFPPAPANLTATPASPTAILLSWSASAGATKYVVERRPSWSPGFTEVAEVSDGQTTYTDAGLIEAATYYYQVRARGSFGDSARKSASTSTLYYTPTIANPATASASTVTGTTVNLAVLGAVTGGESKLRYIWSIVSKPASAPSPSFSTNTINSSKNATATFGAAGNYTFLATISNGNQSVSSSVSVVVQQQVTNIVVSSRPANDEPDGKFQFTADARDQFGQEMAVPQSFAWSIPPDSSGTISADGLYSSADPSAVAPAAVQVSAGGMTKTAVTNPGYIKYTLKGDYVAAGVGIRGKNAGTITIGEIPSGATVKGAYLYWAYLANSENPAFAKLGFDGVAITGSRIGTGIDTNWGLNSSYSYRADVTKQVTGNDMFTLTNIVSSSQSLAQGASLVVIYNDELAVAKTVIIQDGNSVIYYAGDSFTKQFKDFYAVGPVEARTTFIVGDGQDDGSTDYDDRAKFTGSTGQIPWTNSFTGADGAYWDTQTYDVSSTIKLGDTSASVSITGDGDCLMWVAQIFSVTSPMVDLDVDSDNSGTVDRSPEEDRIEADEKRTGYLIAVETEDDDRDGVPGFADGYNRDGNAGNADDSAGANQKFGRMFLEIPQSFDLSNVKIRITYLYSDPSVVSVNADGKYIPDGGRLRIWTKDASAARNPAAASASGDFVPSGVYDPSQLGLSGSKRTIPLFLEGIAAGSVDILVEIDPDGAGPAGYVTRDSVLVRVVNVDLDVNGNGSLLDAVDGAMNYLPGYEGKTQKISTGNSFKNTTFVGQNMSIIADGVGAGMGIDSVQFSLTTTSHLGYAGNAGLTDPAFGPGGANNNDFSFLQSTNGISAMGVMAQRLTSVDFWAKDYGGAAVVKVEFMSGGRVILTVNLRVPLDMDSDGISDAWERQKVQEWNVQYGTSHPVDVTVFSNGDDSELQDPDGGTGILSFSYGPAMGNQAAVGDGKTVFQEYRGYIFDGGGYDWNGTNNLNASGHTRLNPAFKELLVEVDAMAGIAHLPTDIRSWMNTVSWGMSQAVDGAGIRMFYVLDDLATTFSTLPSPASLVAYDQANANADMPYPTFRHLQLVSRFGFTPQGGLSTRVEGSNYAVDFGFDFANYYSISTDISAAAFISHELAHIITYNGGNDGAGHFNDPNGDGTSADADDQTRVNWNYFYNYPSRLLTVEMNSASTSITLDSTAGLTTAGLIRIGGFAGELIAYTGIVGNTLIGLTRGFDGTPIANSSAVGTAVTPAYYAMDMRRIRYGYGTVRFIDVR